MINVKCPHCNGLFAVSLPTKPRDKIVGKTRGLALNDQTSYTNLTARAEQRAAVKKWLEDTLKKLPSSPSGWTGGCNLQCHESHVNLTAKERRQVAAEKAAGFV